MDFNKCWLGNKHSTFPTRIPLQSSTLWGGAMQCLNTIVAPLLQCLVYFKAQSVAHFIFRPEQQGLVNYSKYCLMLAKCISSAGNKMQLPDLRTYKFSAVQRFTIYTTCKIKILNTGNTEYLDMCRQQQQYQNSRKNPTYKRH